MKYVAAILHLQGQSKIYRYIMVNGKILFQEHLNYVTISVTYKNCYAFLRCSFKWNMVFKAYIIHEYIFMHQCLKHSAY